MDFKNTLIVLTSNLGSEHMATGDDVDDELVRHKVMETVRAAFRPEFLNRLDEQIIFHRLSRENMDAIVDIQLEHLQKLLADRRIELDLDRSAYEWIANRGYDPVYGARPLKRVIQRYLQNPLASQILEGNIADGTKVKVSASEEGLIINNELADAA